MASEALKVAGCMECLCGKRVTNAILRAVVEPIVDFFTCVAQVFLSFGPLRWVRTLCFPHLAENFTLWDGCLDCCCCCCRVCETVDCARADRIKRTWLAKKKQSGRGRQSLLWIVIHSVCAFLLGLIIGVFFFYTITFDFGYDITTCTYVTAVVVSFMSLGMAFSLTVRAAFILMLPYLFSKEGRIVVISMAMLTVARGPAQNIKNNFQAFATSMACGAEMATNQTKEMIRRAATPLLAMIDQIETVSGKLKSLSSEVGRIFTAIKEGVMFIWTSICNAADWLMNVGENCNRIFEDPYEKCLAGLDDGYRKCKEELHWIINWVCGIVNSVKWVCEIVKVGKVFCLVPQKLQNFIQEKVSDSIGRKLDGMKNQFAFNLSVHHKLSVDRGGSASAPQIARSIMAEVNRRTVYLDHVIALFTDVAFVAIVYLFVRCLYYRHNYLYSDDFDNVYITERFVRVDLIRTRLGEEPLLPLNRGEASRYITPRSPYMSLEEKEIFGSNFVEWLGCFFYAVFFVCLDHGVYGILSTVAEFLSVEVFAQAPMKMKLKVEGDGIMANIFSVLAEAFDTLQDGQFQVITKKCAPSPSYLPVARIFHIGAMFGLALFVTVFQVYGMRLRRLVCSNYYPVRERERILFLYNKILCRRPGQLKSMWRAIRRNAKDGSHSGFLLILATRITCLMPIVNLLGIYEKHCMACACPATRHSASSFKHCVVPGCMGYYCSGCMEKLKQCTLCMSPADYGDLSDLSQVMDSSDEELCRGVGESLRRRRRRRERKPERALLRDVENDVQGTAESSSSGGGGEERLDFSYQYRRHGSEEVEEDSEESRG
ncbi:DC-STAMP domain-containing protein 2 isoform X2 [Petromyzon marinus]|uniref:DC-STAMP domain-containing protein 2 isoform X2 n=1 Tax=Petromyzon marinus TaxID=7757 RepID=UPI003F71FBFD